VFGASLGRFRGRFQKKSDSFSMSWHSILFGMLFQLENRIKKLLISTLSKSKSKPKPKPKPKPKLKHKLILVASSSLSLCA
jgi:hypothetical protein